jgi:hypothetical protein
MNTYEARTYMRDIAREALEIVERPSSGTMPTFANRRRLHEMVTEARGVLGDAGFPGEAVWRAVQRASIAVDTSGEEPDTDYWRLLEEELQAGLDTLNSLVSTDVGREIEFRIVG